MNDTFLKILANEIVDSEKDIQIYHQLANVFGEGAVEEGLLRALERNKTLKDLYCKITGGNEIHVGTRNKRGT